MLAKKGVPQPFQRLRRGLRDPTNRGELHRWVPMEPDRGDLVDSRNQVRQVRQLHQQVVKGKFVERQQS